MIVITKFHLKFAVAFLVVCDVHFLFYCAGFYFGYVGYFRSSLVEAVYAVFSAILFPPRSHIASAVFWNAPF